MSAKVNKVIVCGNILRYINGQAFDTPLLYPIFKYLLGAYSNVEITKFHGNISKNFVKSFYSALGIEKQLPKSWIDIYNMNNNDNSLKVISDYFSGSLVIAFELHPILQKGFDILNIPYVKLMNHPIRYMDDIFFGITSSSIDTFHKLRKYEISDQYYYKYAMLLKAESGVKEFLGKVKIPENSAVFFAQTNVDCSLLNGNKIVNLFDYKEKFLEICNSYSNVYYKIHPFDKNREVIKFVNSIPNVKILYPNDINVYDILSNDNVKKCFSISSGSLYEAKYFGKSVEYFLKQPFDFVNDFQDGEVFDYKNTYIPIYKTFWKISFWCDVLSEYLPCDKEFVDIDVDFSNKLRRIFGLTWGYVDCDSVFVKDYLNEILINNSFSYKIRKFVSGFISCLLPKKRWRRKIRKKINKNRKLVV